MLMMPAVQRDALGGHPGGAPGADGALEVADHGDEDVDGHDDEREALEPVRLADSAPRVLDGHEADTADGGRVELRVVEPAVHVHVRGVVERPLLADAGADGNGDEVRRQRDGQHDEAEHAACLRAARHFVDEDQPDEHDGPAEPLVQGVLPVDLEQHDTLLLQGTLRTGRLPACCFFR